MSDSDSPWSRRRVLKTGAATFALSAAPFGCRHDSDGATTTIELWTLSLQTFSDYMFKLIASFEASRPGVRVEWVDVPFDAIERKLVAAIAAGKGPDVVNMSDLTFARFASLGAFADHDRIAPIPAEQVYIDGVLGMCRIEDALRAVPWYLTTQAVLANEALLAQGEMDVAALPTRWGPLLDAADDFRRTTGAFLFSHPLGHESQLPSMLLADGVNIFEPGDDGTLRARLATDQARLYLEPWIEAFSAGLVPREAATKGHAHLVEGYQSGRLGLINTGPNFLGRIRDASPSVFESTVVRPAITGSLGRPHVSVMVLGVTNGSPQQQLAAELVWHMTSPEAQLAFCEIVNILPSTPASLRSPLFDPPAGFANDAEAKIARARALTADVLPDAVAFTPSLAAWPDMRKEFEDRITRVLLGTELLEDALVLIESRWNRLLEVSGGGAIDAIPTPTQLANV